jgi:hypothetical protein
MSPYGYGKSNLLRVDDPQMQKKYAKLTGDRTASVVVPSELPAIDKIAADAQKARRERLRKNMDT